MQQEKPQLWKIGETPFDFFYSPPSAPTTHRSLAGYGIMSRPPRATLWIMNSLCNESFEIHNIIACQKLQHV